MCYSDHRLTFIRHDQRFGRDSIEIAPKYQDCVAAKAKALRLRDQGDGVYTIPAGRDSESTIQAVERVMDRFDEAAVHDGNA